MVKHSPHKRWRGHCMMCKGHKDRRQGDRELTPFRELRKIGKNRRFKRNDVVDD